MGIRTSLGICNDPMIKELASRVQKNIMRPGEGITLASGKSYYLTHDHAMVHADKEVGRVYKFYSRREDDWHLTHREVANNRGSYIRSIRSKDGGIKDSVTLGGRETFIRQKNGDYIRPATEHYPATYVKSEELEAAIDYVKGKGSAENYTKFFTKK